MEGVGCHVVEGLSCQNARKYVRRGDAGEELQIACVLRRWSVVGAIADKGEQPAPVLLREQAHATWTPRLRTDQDQLVLPEVAIRNLEVPARVRDVDHQLLLGRRWKSQCLQPRRQLTRSASGNDREVAGEDLVCELHPGHLRAPRTSHKSMDRCAVYEPDI